MFLKSFCCFCPLFNSILVISVFTQFVFLPNIVILTLSTNSNIQLFSIISTSMYCFQKKWANEDWRLYRTNTTPLWSSWLHNGRKALIWSASQKNPRIREKQYFRKFYYHSTVIFIESEWEQYFIFQIFNTTDKNILKEKISVIICHSKSNFFAEANFLLSWQNFGAIAHFLVP